MILPNIYGLELIEIEEPKRKPKTRGQFMPFGWKICEDDKKYIEPIPEQLEALEKAAWYIEVGYSGVSTRDWLVRTTGRNITREGMLKAIENVRSRNPDTNEIQEKGHY